MAYQLTGGQDEIPDSPSFLVPLCTNRERFQLILDALTFAARNDPENGFKYTVDFLQAWQYLRDPENSPCVQGLVNFPPPSENCCTEYPPYAEEIEWNPQNPFTEPTKKPSGYKKPVWKLHQSDDSLGRKSGDVYIDPSSVIFFDSGLPIPTPGDLGDFADFLYHLPTTGFPRFRVTVQGTGVLELHLMQAPLAGLCLITVDDSPTGFDVVNMGTIALDDFESLLDGVETLDDLLIGGLDAILPNLLDGLESGNPSGLYQPYVKEIEFREGGEHHVDLTFLPNFSVSPPFINGFGGGLRKIVLCGFDKVVKPRKPIIRQDEENPENIEWWDGTKWVFLQKLVPYPVSADSGCDCDDCGCDDCDDCDCDDDCDDCEEW